MSSIRTRAAPPRRWSGSPDLLEGGAAAVAAAGGPNPGGSRADVDQSTFDDPPVFPTPGKADDRGLPQEPPAADATPAGRAIGAERTDRSSSLETLGLFVPPEDPTPAQPPRPFLGSPGLLPPAEPARPGAALTDDGTREDAAPASGAADRADRSTDPSASPSDAGDGSGESSSSAGSAGHGPGAGASDGPAPAGNEPLRPEDRR